VLSGHARNGGQVPFSLKLYQGLSSRCSGIVCQIQRVEGVGKRE